MWHEPYGLEQPDEAGRREMLADLGGDAPIDIGLRGGETIRLGRGRRLEVLHLPGHTLGHVECRWYRAAAPVRIRSMASGFLFSLAIQ